MSCVRQKKRNNQSNPLSIIFSRSDDTEVPKTVKNLILSYTNQTLEEFDDNDFTQKLFFLVSINLILLKCTKSSPVQKFPIIEY